MMVGILQSAYLPWLGVFDMLDRADAFIFHDDIQFDRSWSNRNRIRTSASEGWSWLSVPVKLAEGHRTLLDHAEISYEHKWNRKHWSLLQQNYCHAPHFETYADSYRALLLDTHWERLVDLNLALVKLGMEQIGVQCPLHFSHDLGLGELRSNERVLAICERVGADRWLANSACRNYVVPALYERAGVTVVYQDYVHPHYPQQWEPFVSHLSFVDLLFNCGSRSLEIIRSTRTG